MGVHGSTSIISYPVSDINIEPHMTKSHAMESFNDLRLE